MIRKKQITIIKKSKDQNLYKNQILRDKIKKKIKIKYIIIIIIKKKNFFLKPS
jgi:hypothetical protein